MSLISFKSTISLISFKSASSFTAKLFRLESSGSTKDDSPAGDDRYPHQEVSLRLSPEQRGNLSMYGANQADETDRSNETGSISSPARSVGYLSTQERKSRPSTRPKRSKPASTDKLTTTVLSSTTEDSKLLNRYLKDCARQARELPQSARSAT
jgi:hypothetical protein